jgi:predicted  nucleic acid-binding Zn-ribbon protein
VVAQVADIQADNIDGAKRAVGFAALAAVMSGLEIAVTVIEGASDAGSAAAEWVLCAATLGLAVNACVAAGLHTAAAALTGALMIAHIAAAASNATAAGIAGTALRLADSSASPSDVCPPTDTTHIVASLATAKTELAAAQTARTAVQAKINAKNAEITTALNARATAVATLRAAIRGGGSASEIDARVDTLTSHAESWGTHSYDYDAAVARVSRATSERDMWNADIAKYDAMLADLPGTITRLNGEIAALDAQIASNPANVQDLKDERAGKAAERDMARDRPGLEAVRQDAVDSRAAAQAVLNTAVADRNTATQNVNTARSNYEIAYSALGSGRYAITEGPTAYACIGDAYCQEGDTNVTTAVSNALNELFGSGASTAPSKDATYLRPAKLRAELKALEEEMGKANQRVTDAQVQVDTMQQMVDNPSACNVTGSAVTPMSTDQADAILEDVDSKGGMR